MKPPALCVYGEVLFDHFPDGMRVLGGAPFNVAWHLQAFGLAPRLISRVGTDAEGDEVLAAMRDWGMDTQGMQIDPQRPTGKVMVSLNNQEPSYDIVTDCAYDAIEPDPALLPPGCLFYHGSLAVRAPISRDSLDTLLGSARDSRILLDVNLRPPWWDREQILHMLEAAAWVKLNQDELALLTDGSDDITTRAGMLLAAHHLEGLIVTLGAEGASALTADGSRYLVKPGHDTTIVDTVGAGDAFTAVTMLGITHGWPIVQTLERAQQFASTIVGQRGATVRDPDFYRPLRTAWNLDTESAT